MNYQRAVGFAALLYIAAFLVGILAFAFGWANSTGYSTSAFVLTWVLYIPAVLILAKWYFKAVAPTTRRGFLLGVITILVSAVLDLIFIGITAAMGESVEAFVQLYKSWEFYVTVMWVVLLTTFAGYEFDKTYTKMDHPPKVE